MVSKVPIVADFGPLRLLVLQASPFCNINCRYCYLPDRALTERMPVEVAEAAVRFVLDAGLVQGRVTICWHAGEPLAVPVSYYRTLIPRLEDLCRGRCEILYNVQTNATTINQEWCDLFRLHDFSVGVSLDGPQFLHDAYRVTRSGKGTFARAMRGVELLRQNNIEFHVISVLTKASLKFAQEILEFFIEIGASRVGFNIEETEGGHSASSIAKGTEAEYIEFLSRIEVLLVGTEARKPLAIREIGGMDDSILRWAAEQQPARSEECAPFTILTVDSKGHLSTFSPELHGNTGEAYSSFRFGNVLTDSLADVVANPSFRLAMQEIDAGIAMCKRDCQYFGVCGGGSPSNKYYENGTFASTETTYCRHKVQIGAELALRRMQRKLDPAVETAA